MADSVLVLKSLLSLLVGRSYLLILIMTHMTGLANGMALEVTDFCIEAPIAIARSVCLASVPALPGPVRVDPAVWFPE